MIDPDSWTDEKVAELSLTGHLTWLALVSLADDEGRIEWSARQLKIRAFPVKDEMTVDAIESALAEVIAAGLIEAYVVNGRTYAHHPHWGRHQQISHPAKSRIPAPTDAPERSDNPVETQEHRGAIRKSPEVSGKLRNAPPKRISIGGESSAPNGAGAERAVQPVETPFGLADWFWSEANSRNLVDTHRVARRDRDVRSWLKSASDLLAAYSPAEIQARARRYLDAISAGRNALPTLRAFAEAWGYPWVTTPAGPVMEHGWDRNGKPVSKPRGTFLDGFTTIPPAVEIA